MAYARRRSRSSAMESCAKLAPLKDKPDWDVAVAYLHTLALRQTYPWFFITNDKYICFSSGKRVVNSILDMNDVEASIMTLTMRDHTDTAHITTACCHCNNASVKSDKFRDLPSRQINLDSIIDLNGRIGVANSVFRSRQRLRHESTKTWSND